MDKSRFISRPHGELCPFDAVKWEGLKEQWNCSDQELYHCLPNQYNFPGQICLKPNWVLKNYCPIYNTVAAKIDLIPCDSQYGACSDRDYRSNQVYKYSGCLNKTEILPEDTDTPPEQVASSPSLSILIPTAVAVVVLILIVVLVTWLLRRRRNARKYERFEMEPLLGQSDIPPGFQKTLDYLKSGVYYPSKLYLNAIGALDVHHCITIVGPPGSGKTLTAVKLAYLKCGIGRGSQLYFCRTLEEVRSTAAERKNAYIIMDDWLDMYMYYPSKICQAIDLLNKIYDDFVKNGSVHLILTAQEDKFSRFRDFQRDCILFNKKHLFITNSKMSDKKWRQNVITCHFEHFEIEENAESPEDEFGDKTIVGKNTQESLAKKIKDVKEFSFPVMLDLICTNERLMKARNLIIRDGFKHILKMFLDNWYKDDDMKERRSFCILVFAALLGGKVSPKDFQSAINSPLFARICKEYKCTQEEKAEIGKLTSHAEKGSKTEQSDEMIQMDSSLENSFEMLLDRNNRLRACLYKFNDQQDNTIFIFQHSSLFRFVLSYIKDSGEEFFIDNANIEVLTKECWLDEGILDKLIPGISEASLKSFVGSVILKSSVFKSLAKRIRSEKELHGYNIPEWDKHIFMSQETFKKMWEKVNSKESHQS